VERGVSVKTNNLKERREMNEKPNHAESRIMGMSEEVKYSAMAS
jgi:hypothetical protein